MSRPSQTSKTPTIFDVAKTAKVSIKTVSRVVNNEPGVRARTRDAVLQAIDRLGYRRNMFARGLRAERSLMIGLIYENPQGDYPADILYGALAACGAAGYHLSVEVAPAGGLEERTRRFLNESRVDGVLVTPPICDQADILAAFRAHGTPYVRISPREAARDERYVGIDDFAAGFDAARHLIRLGHRRIGLIRGLPGHGATLRREAGFRAAMAEAGLAVSDEDVRGDGFDHQTGAAAARYFLDLADPPTAILASNDEAAAGVLSVAHERDVSVPHALSVCGFDGGVVSQVVWPRLTTVRQPVRTLGREAVRILIERLSSHADAPEGAVILPHELVEGASTAPPQAR